MICVIVLYSNWRSVYSPTVKFRKDTLWGRRTWLKIGTADFGKKWFAFSFFLFLKIKKYLLTGSDEGNHQWEGSWGARGNCRGRWKSYNKLQLWPVGYQMNKIFILKQNFRVTVFCYKLETKAKGWWTSLESKGSIGKPKMVNERSHKFYKKRLTSGWAGFGMQRRQPNQWCPRNS